MMSDNNQTFWDGKFFTEYECKTHFKFSDMNLQNNVLIMFKPYLAKKWIWAWENFVTSNETPTGWTLTSAAKLKRKDGWQSPMLLLMHELGHAWQWATDHANYLDMNDTLYTTRPWVRANHMGQSPASFKLDIHNIHNVEAVVAYELEEGIRFSYCMKGKADPVAYLKQTGHEAKFRTKLDGRDNAQKGKWTEAGLAPPNALSATADLSAAIDLQKYCARYNDNKDLDLTPYGTL